MAKSRVFITAPTAREGGGGKVHIFEGPVEDPGTLLKELLKKVLYLDPSYIPAYLDLAEAYDREKDWKRARRLRVSALERLRQPGAEAQAELYEGATPAELMLTLEAVVKVRQADER